STSKPEATPASSRWWACSTATGRTPPHLRPLCGRDAIALWEGQRRGEAGALQRLVEYNLYDTFPPRPLAEQAYNRILRRTGMPAPPLEVTERGALLYDVSCAVLRATRSRRCVPGTAEWPDSLPRTEWPH